MQNTVFPLHRRLCKLITFFFGVSDIASAATFIADAMADGYDGLCMIRVDCRVHVIIVVPCEVFTSRPSVRSVQSQNDG